MKLTMKFTMKFHAKHQRFCLLRLLDLNDLAGAGADTATVAGTTALAVLFRFRVPSSCPSLIPNAIVGSGATV
jgi:hypothetical protein